MNEAEERKAVERKEDFNQVCVWPNTLIGKDEVEKFEGWVKENFGVRVQYLEEYKTNPNPDDFKGETGGRNDAVFAVNKEDVAKFAIPRLQMGIRWVEDVLDNAENNNKLSIYPTYLKDYRTW